MTLSPNVYWHIHKAETFKTQIFSTQTMLLSLFRICLCVCFIYHSQIKSRYKCKKFRENHESVKSETCHHSWSKQQKWLYNLETNCIERLYGMVGIDSNCVRWPLKGILISNSNSSLDRKQNLKWIKQIFKMNKRNIGNV